MNGTTTWVFDWPGRLPPAENCDHYGDRERAAGVHGRLSWLVTEWQSQKVRQGCQARASSLVRDMYAKQTCWPTLIFAFSLLCPSTGFAAADKPEPLNNEGNNREEAEPLSDISRNSSGSIQGASTLEESQNTSIADADNTQAFRPCKSRPNSAPEMVVIAGGAFIMGSNDYDTEQPLREVRVSTFAIGRCEVSFADWQPCVDQGVCENLNDEGWENAARPVINISWNDTQSYITWLNNKTGKQYRLPTEAEWEYAARAGTVTKYSWGDEPDGNYANGDEEFEWPDDGFRDRTAPVANYLPNPWGLYDMHGNVYEWVEDCWHDDYTNAPDDGRAWLNENNGNCDRRRVVRGGSWDSYPVYLRSADRIWFNSDERNFNLGFRLARTLEK